MNKLKPEPTKSVKAATAALVKTAAGKSRASRSGKKGEDTVAAYSAVAQMNGVARLFKVPTPTRRVKRGPNWSMVYCARSNVDLCGFLLDDSGRHVAIEIKCNTSKKSQAMSEVEPHQREYLDAVLAAGGVALLVVVYTKEHLVCEFDWGGVRDEKTLTEEVLRAHVVTPETYLRSYANNAQSHMDVGQEAGR